MALSGEVDPPRLSAPGHLPLLLRVALRGMRPEDKFEVLLPADHARMGVWELLERVFPEEGAARREIESSLDLRANPDLPEIYAVMLDAFTQYRLGYCTLTVLTNEDARVAPDDAVAKHLQGIECRTEDFSDPVVLEVLIQQEYQVLESALVRKHWDDKTQLLEWLRSLTLLYFLDKHEVEISGIPAAGEDGALLAAAEALRQADIIEPMVETGIYAITEAGRSFLGSLLSETESHIDRFDIFKDVAFDGVSGRTEFGMGRGEDLRVQVFMAEGLDPIRVVFLLRMYDGSLDAYLPVWVEQLELESIFNEILEPVANHYRVPDDAIGRVIESGLALLDEQAESERLERSRQGILSRLSVNPSGQTNGDHL